MSPVVYKSNDDFVLMGLISVFGVLFVCKIVICICKYCKLNTENQTRLREDLVLTDSSNISQHNINEVDDIDEELLSHRITIVKNNNINFNKQDKQDKSLECIEDDDEDDGLPSYSEVIPK